MSGYDAVTEEMLAHPLDGARAGWWALQAGGESTILYTR
jgi:hypothetical protein